MIMVEKIESLDPVIILTGTDPSSSSGGIGFALPGYIQALCSQNIAYQSIPTYHPATFYGKFWPLIIALPKIARLIYNMRRNGKFVVVWSHAGAGLSLIREFVVLTMSGFFGAKTILHIHSLETSRYLKSPILSKIFKAAFSQVTRIVVLTPWWKNTFIRAGIENNVIIVPNPLPPYLENIATSNKSKRNPGHPIYIFTMTRIEPGKGIGLAIEAMAYVQHDIQLIIAGDGSKLSFFKELVNKKKLSDRIIFTGWVNEREKTKLFQNAVVFCLPTTYDSFGMVFLEAMAHGLPVVALDWGPISDVIADNVTGRLIKQQSPKLLAKTIDDMLGGKQLELMGEKSRQLVLQKYSAKTIGKLIRSALLDIYHEN